MPLVEALRVDLPDVFHSSTQLRIRAADEKVVVIRHQAVRVYLDAKSLDCLGDDIEEQSQIFVV